MTTEIFHAGEICPSGFSTTIGIADPAVEIDPVAVNCEEEIHVVASTVPLSVAPAPPWNALPLMVSVKVPVFSWLGVTDEMVGAGNRMVTEADPRAAGTAMDVAPTVTVGGDGGSAGAV